MRTDSAAAGHEEVGHRRADLPLALWVSLTAVAVVGAIILLASRAAMITDRATQPLWRSDSQPIALTPEKPSAVRQITITLAPGGVRPGEAWLAIRLGYNVPVLLDMTLTREGQSEPVVLEPIPDDDGGSAMGGRVAVLLTSEADAAACTERYTLTLALLGSEPVETFLRASLEAPWRPPEGSGAWRTPSPEAGSIAITPAFLSARTSGGGTFTGGTTVLRDHVTIGLSPGAARVLESLVKLKVEARADAADIQIVPDGESARLRLDLVETPNGQRWWEASFVPFGPAEAGGVRRAGFTIEIRRSSSVYSTAEWEATATAWVDAVGEQLDMAVDGERRRTGFPQ